MHQQAVASLGTLLRDHSVDSQLRTRKSIPRLALLSLSRLKDEGSLEHLRSESDVEKRQRMSLRRIREGSSSSKKEEEGEEEKIREEDDDDFDRPIQSIQLKELCIGRRWETAAPRRDGVAERRGERAALIEAVVERSLTLFVQVDQEQEEQRKED